MPVSPSERHEEKADAAAPSAVYAKIARTPEAIDEKVYVKVPSFDGGEQLHGPCPWEPRVGGGFVVMFPQEGNEALVQSDEDGDLWILMWWPYD